jgi:5'-nucleotidase
VMPGPPDLVLSGVNAGQNVCDDVTYSGTVAGAIEGTMLGFRSIALSQAHGADRATNWSVVETHAPSVLAKLAEIEFPKGVLFNVNFPAVSADQVTGTEMTRQGKLDYNLGLEERKDGRGFPYFWLKFGRQVGAEMAQSDIGALMADLTDHALREKLHSLFA